MVYPGSVSEMCPYCYSRVKKVTFLRQPAHYFELNFVFLKKIEGFRFTELWG